MTRADLQKWMEQTFKECMKLREQGQAEYARREENAFGNFERVAERLKLSREAVLMVYLEKHLDGIAAWVEGHRSQREDVRGRINDAITYLCLLRGMVEETNVFIPQNMTDYGMNGEAFTDTKPFSSEEAEEVFQRFAEAMEKTMPPKNGLRRQECNCSEPKLTEVEGRGSTPNYLKCTCAGPREACSVCTPVF